MLTEQDINRDMLTLTIIFFAILASLAAYLAVGLIMAGSAKISMNDATLTIIRTVLYGLAGLILFITKPVRKFILKKGVQGARQAGAFNHPEVQKYALAMIVASAMTEAIGIFGLVLFLLSKSRMDLYVLLAVAAFAMWQYRPKKEEVMALFEQSFTNQDTRL